MVGMRILKWVFITVLFSTLSACSLAPTSHRPMMPMPMQYKETGQWVMNKPTLMTAKKNCPWWTVFQDDALNQLEQRLTTGNQDLKMALARFDEARALLQSARSQLYPTILGEASASRQQNSENSVNILSNPTMLYNMMMVGAYLNYEIDAWGMVRNTVSAAKHYTQASEFDLASIDLSLHAMLASTYFELRFDNEAQVVLDRYVAAYQHAKDLTHQLHQGGAASAFEEHEAVNLLEHAKTNALAMRLKRAQLEHALAVLVGEIPANFKLPRLKKPIYAVIVKPALPSALLTQRPDIAAAAQRVQSANASIGVARAAFFPQLKISSLIGYQSQHLSRLLSTPSFVWALGPPSGLIQMPAEITQVLFDGYQLQALLKKANANYYQTVDNYRQTVLVAFKDVEDSLVAVHRLNQACRAQTAATHAAQGTLFQARQRWKIGIYTFLDVVSVEDAALQAELNLINLQSRRQRAEVQLIEALGGGWQTPRIEKV